MRERLLHKPTGKWTHQKGNNEKSDSRVFGGTKFFSPYKDTGGCVSVWPRFLIFIRCKMKLTQNKLAHFAHLLCV